MTNYQLINPYIKGDFKRLFSGKSPVDAAQGAWDTLSQNFTNNVPKFAFTLERISDNSQHHFVVREKTTDGEVNYTLEELNLKNKRKGLVRKFNNKIKQLKKNKTLSDQDGGAKKKKKKDDDDSSSSSSSDSDNELHQRVDMMLYNPLAQPILYWWYSPVIYELDYLYMPTFVNPLSPYVEIDIEL